MSLLSGSLLLLTAVLTAPPVGDSDWNQFRGPGGGGVAADHIRLPRSLDLENPLRWEVEIDAGASSPCVVDGRVFVTGHVGNELSTTCIDLEEGRILWRRTIEVGALERTHETHGPASPTPVADAERVVVAFGSLGLVAFDHEGEELWRRELNIPKNTFGTAASPILVGGKLIHVSDSNQGSFLTAFDPAEGTTLWRREREGFQSGWSSPRAWSRGEGTELLVQGDWWLNAYDLAEGAELWSLPGLTDEPITTPATGNGLVFVTSYNMRTNPEVIGLPTFESLLALHDHDGNGELDAEEAAENDSVLSRPDADGEGDHPLRMFFRFLDENRSGTLDAQEWKKLVAWLDGFEFLNAVLAIRPPSGEQQPEIVWQFPRGVPECPSPLFYRDRVWLVMNGGVVTSRPAGHAPTYRRATPCRAGQPPHRRRRHPPSPAVTSVGSGGVHGVSQLADVRDP
jgi:hypothetical protein